MKTNRFLCASVHYDSIHFKKIIEPSLSITSVTLVLGHDNTNKKISRIIWFFILKVVINCFFFLL